MPAAPPPDGSCSPGLPRRIVLAATGTLGVLGIAGCRAVVRPASGGPGYKTIEIDDGPVIATGLQDATVRDYYAALVVAEADTETVAFERLSDADARFISETDFEASYLGLIQVSALPASMRLDVVELDERDATLTANVAVRTTSPQSEDRVITTLVLRVAREGDGVPDTIAVELDIGEQQETFSGSRP